tara:strand:+ start:1843 stop:2307 length:465 start_codon:yes stop_codon:yes gene_type:complete
MGITGWWWIAFFVLVGAELITGTFYLLMAALGVAAAALLSHADTTLAQQVAIAAVISSGSVAFWHFSRIHRRNSQHATLDAVSAMDVGHTVTVTEWRDDTTAIVHYRGANWTALPAELYTELHVGTHRIVSLDGARLRLLPATTNKQPTNQLTN